MKKNIIKTIGLGTLVSAFLVSGVLAANSSLTDLYATEKSGYPKVESDFSKDRGNIRFKERGNGPETTLAATVLGITTEDLNTQLKDGAKLYDILVNANKLEAFKSAMIDDLQEKMSNDTSGVDNSKMLEEISGKINAWDGETGIMGKGDRGEHGFKERGNGPETTLAATVLGITTEDLNTQLKDGAKLYDILVNANKLEAFKSAMIADLQEKMSNDTSGVDNSKMLEEISGKINAWDGETGIMGKGDRGEHGFKERGNGPETTIAATVLGITTEDLNTQLKDGAKLYDILVNANKLEAFKSAMIADLQEKMSNDTSGIDNSKMLEEISGKINAWDGETGIMGKGVGPKMHKNDDNTVTSVK